MTNPISILCVETTVDPVVKKKKILKASKDLSSDLLSELNKLSKNGFILLKWKNELWRISHTVARPPSKTYFKEKVKYHPYEKEL